MSSRTSYPKRRNTQSVKRPRRSAPSRAPTRPTHYSKLKHADNREVDQTGPQEDRVAFLTTTEAASYLRVSKQFLEIARHKGAGPPYIKLARAVRYHKASLDQWMLQRQRNHTAEGEV